MPGSLVRFPWEKPISFSDLPEAWLVVSLHHLSSIIVAAFSASIMSFLKKGFLAYLPTTVNIGNIEKQSLPTDNHF